jgi:hypothetical protein
MISGASTNIDAGVKMTEPSTNVWAKPRLDHPGYAVSDGGDSSKNQDEVGSNASFCSQESIKDVKAYLEDIHGRYVRCYLYDRISFIDMLQ